MPAPATRSRRTPKVSGDDRERAILAAFERLLEERSLHEVSIDDIARGAGISRPTFYFYFASKEAVLLSLFERLLAEGQARRGDALERLAEDPAARVRESLTAFHEVFRAHKAVTLAGADARATSAELRDVWRHVMEGWVGEVARRDRGRAGARGGAGGRPRARPGDQPAAHERARPAHELRPPRAGGRGGRGRRRARRHLARRRSTAPPSRRA